MDLKLGNKIVAITGPVKGMGEAITRAFAEEGAKLALLAGDTQAVASLEQALREQERTSCWWHVTSRTPTSASGQ